MGIKTWLYLCRLGFKNLWSQRVYTAATVITMSACIFLFGIFYAAALNVNHVLQKTGEDVYVAVFFRDDATGEEVDNVGSLIRKRPEVLKTVYVSPDEAWDSFKEEYAHDGQALDGIFQGDNPLEGSGNYQVYIRGAENQAGFIAYAAGLPGVRKATGAPDTISALLKLKGDVTRLIWGSTWILLVISVFLIHNTLAVGIEAQKEKNHVMRLMGAREDFIKIPFLAEGVVMGILGTWIPLLLLSASYRWGTDILSSGIGTGAITGLLPFAAVLPRLVRVCLALGILTGGIGSLSVMGKLKKTKKV